MNLLEITFHSDLDNYPDVTYTLNGEVISTVHCLYDDQRKVILNMCYVLKCDIIQHVIKEDGEIDTWSIHKTK